jgi:hypothetical protein
MKWQRVEDSLIIMRSERAEFMGDGGIHPGFVTWLNPGNRQFHQLWVPRWPTRVRNCGPVEVDHELTLDKLALRWRVVAGLSPVLPNMRSDPYMFHNPLVSPTRFPIGPKHSGVSGWESVLVLTRTWRRPGHCPMGTGGAAPSPVGLEATQSYSASSIRRDDREDFLHRSTARHPPKPIHR